MPPQLVITGASGALGRNLLANPPSGFDIRLVSANDHLLQREGYPTLSVSALPKEQWGPSTSILHFAAAKPKSAPAKLERVHVKFTFKLAELARSKKVKDFIFTSCLSGPAAHLAAKERAEKALGKVFKASSTRLVILRLPPLYGPYFKGEVQILTRLALAGVRLPLAGLGARSPRLSANNLIQAITQILQQEGPSGSFCFSDQENLTLGEVHEIIYQALRPQKKGCYAFPPLAWMERLSQSWEKRHSPIPWAEGLHRLFRESALRGTQLTQAYELKHQQSALKGLQELARWHQTLDDS